MSPATQISQQPQPEQVEMTTPPTDGIVSQQPTQTEAMTTEPQMHLRGGGMVGDWYGSPFLKFFLVLVALDWIRSHLITSFV
ncbi:hypothetical protein LARI1_G005611 [Lachnellula arida]|uniref:Uncharacterized protein n=1 Tax=Lachnellula arida TaxID=1316785 RepID=A0A8T9BB77_9HELO|nr:hypothetical protein LARI1_G005611 [Lachnellula arida]